MVIPLAGGGCGALSNLEFRDVTEMVMSLWDTASSIVTSVCRREYHRNIDIDLEGGDGLLPNFFEIGYSYCGRQELVAYSRDRPRDPTCNLALVPQ